MSTPSAIDRLLGRARRAVRAGTPRGWLGGGTLPPGFDEAAYLRANPDVASAVETGAVASGAEHYRRRGEEERRALVSGQSRSCIELDAALAGPDGTLLVTGWIDDEASPCEMLELSLGSRRVALDARDLLRSPRGDVAAVLGRPASSHPFGFAALARFESAPAARPQAVAARVRFASSEQSQAITSRPVGEEPLFEALLDQLVKAHRSDIDVFPDLIPGPPRPIREGLARIWRQYIDGASVEVDVSFGAPVAPKLSVVTAVYGTALPLSVQAALLYSGVPRQDLEVLVVNNSPSLVNELVREIELARKTHDVGFRLVSMSRNTGFSRANNVAASLARAPRIAFVNPDIYAADRAWFGELTGSAALPFAVCGAVLDYADGSVMHDGMRVTREYADGRAAGLASPGVLRVDHFAKGAAPWSLAPGELRPVQAVSGAFLATTTETFRALGGFPEEYVFGHFEDADFCLRAWQRGLTVGVSRRLRLVHLEGRGAARNPRLQALLYFNRRTFSDRWAESLAEIEAAVAREASA